VGSYVNDAYQSISVEIFIIIMVIKNFLFYGFSRKSIYSARESCVGKINLTTVHLPEFINQWVIVQGPKDFFYT
jgi:hypothetical protein